MNLWNPSGIRESNPMNTAAPVTIRLGPPTANLGLTELRVTPGVIDDIAHVV